MYQMPSEKSADVQQRQNGLPVGLPPEYNVAKSLQQASSSARIEQLEAEIHRLRGALAEKTAEAQNLQLELQSALQIIEKHQLLQQQRQETAADVDAPANEKESRETPTAASSQD